MKIDKNKYLKMIEAFLFVSSDLVDEKDIKLKIPKGINIKKYLSELKNVYKRDALRVAKQRYNNTAVVIFLEGKKKFT